MIMGCFSIFEVIEDVASIFSGMKLERLCVVILISLISFFYLFTIFSFVKMGQPRPHFRLHVFLQWKISVVSRIRTRIIEVEG